MERECGGDAQQSLHAGEGLGEKDLQDTVQQLSHQKEVQPVGETLGGLWGEREALKIKLMWVGRLGIWGGAYVMIVRTGHRPCLYKERDIPRSNSLQAMVSFSNDLMLEAGSGESRTIYCGLPKIDPDNYRRDYVIQRDSKKNSKEENPLEFKWNASLVIIIRILTLPKNILFLL